MILGVGIDLVSVDRIGKIYNKYPERFLDRIFTVQEKNNYVLNNESVNSLAARYAAKEAVLKAIGCGIGPAALNEVEVITVPGQQPVVILHGAALQLADGRNITETALSMTHEPPFACACAVVFNKNNS